MTLLRSRWLLLALPIVVLVVAAAIYSAAASKRYEARAEILVSPVPARDTVFLGFGLLRESGDPGRVVETAGRLVTTPEVADTVRSRLGLHGSTSDVLSDVSTHALGDSYVLAVIGKAGSAVRAAQIANAFAQEAVAHRTGSFQTELATVTRRLRSQLDSTPHGTAEAIALQQRLAALRGLSSTTDPTLRIVSAATAPGGAAWPKPGLLIGLAAAIGAGIAALAGLAALLAPRAVRAPATPEDRAAARRLAQREKEVKRREKAVGEAERMLVRRREKVETLERDLPARAAQVVQRERAAAEPVPELVPPPPEPEPEPAPEPEPVPELLPPARAADGGGWNLNDLQRLVEQRGGAFPDRLPEWESYLFALRDHADIDGRLPSTFDDLVEEAFSDLVRAGSTGPA